MTDVSLAQASNQLIYASMIVLTLAMIGFAVSFAAGARRRGTATAATADVREGALVGAAAGGTSEVRGGSLGAESAPPATSVATSVATTQSERAPLPPGRRSGNIAMALTWLSFALLLGGVVLRGVWAGRVPWGNMYEFSISSAVGILAVFLGLSLFRDVRWLGLPISIVTLLTLGLAVTVLYTEAAQLVPALKSYWLVIHVSAAIICGGAFTISGITAGMYLWRERAERRAGPDGEVTGLASRLPAGNRLDDLTYKIIAFSFPLWTFAIVAGAIWAENAWGRYWGWDPKETWAFITWVVYAAYLHARSTAGWRGRRSAWIAMLGFAVFVINFFGVNLVASGLHSYSGL